MRKYTTKQIEESIAHWKSVLASMNEASYGGEHGVSDPALEPPTQDQLCWSMVNATDESNVDTLISILNEIGLNDNLKKILLNLDDQDMLTDFARTLVASMSAEDYKKYVQILF